jgi:lipoate-protein ligase A
MEDNTISLQQTDWDEARSKKLPERLRQGFAEVFEIDLEWDSQSDFERDRAISLVSTRYGLKSWTLKTHGSPKVAAGV